MFMTSSLRLSFWQKVAERQMIEISDSVTELSENLGARCKGFPQILFFF